MKPADAATMEASLIAVAEAGIDIRHALFERFLAAFPERREAFLNLDAASRRMTDETLQAMLGLATGEGWVWPQIAELVPGEMFIIFEASDITPSAAAPLPRARRNDLLFVLCGTLEPVLGCLRRGVQAGLDRIERLPGLFCLSGLEAGDAGRRPGAFGAAAGQQEHGRRRRNHAHDQDSSATTIE